MPFQKPQITRSRSSQTFNLDELFGVDFSNRADLANQITVAMLDLMIDRTAKGKEIGGEKNFKSPYSKEYKESENYQDFNKTGKVNMELTGGMLGSIDFNVNGNTSEIFIDDELEAAKSENHNLGVTVPKRPFFGLRKKEVNRIKKKFSEDLKKARIEDRAEEEFVSAATTSAVLDLFRSEQERNDLFGGLFG